MTDRRFETTWTPKREETLRQMWERGDPASVIAERLGVSRSSICSKSRRMGLAGRESPIKPLPEGKPSRRALQPENRKRALARAVSDPRVCRENPFEAAIQQQARLDRAKQPSPRFRTCQFIAGQPTADDACKCGRPVERNPEGWPYCAEHYALCKGAPSQKAKEMSA